MNTVIVFVDEKDRVAETVTLRNLSAGLKPNYYALAEELLGVVHKKGGE